MPILPQSVADAVAADGLPRVAVDDGGVSHVLYWDATIVRSMLASAWPPPLPTPPTPQEITAALAARETARQAAIADAAALRAQIVTIAQSAVGVRVDLLTAVQVRALMACVLWKQGALDKLGQVRPLADWLG